MNASPVSRMATSTEPAPRVQDEWGVYDPHQTGMPALMRALENVEPSPAEAAVRGLTGIEIRSSATGA